MARRQKRRAEHGHVGRAERRHRLPFSVAATFFFEGEGFAVTSASDSLTVHTDPKDAERVSMVLGREGLWVSELRAVEADLEKVFLELTTTIEGKGAS